ncbi:alpha/beta hydrolase [Streptomyces sp. Li-HN-5-11]|uniref:alpha/beta hydrolase n=1 Tax=Streptomyces sp. Li-HN-5-11 TaxID=3075432 RepID=UPI0028AD64E2|nr:alpha/beta hydrolase [Streptomyces sp. Li-HN-5-11]WNM31947.1 alpha/beta hydrolase [Streptomyces sp. Li-HN-5-11]
MADAAVSRQDVRFTSGDGECGGWLFLPPDATIDSPVPIVVLGHGLAGLKHQRLDAYAQRFAERGYAALAFDYRHFGSSTGEPRKLADVAQQLEDWRSAVVCARTLEGVDPRRVVLWGTSFAGGHVIVTAAGDPGIAAAIAQCPFSDGLTAARSMPRMTALRLMREAAKDRKAVNRGEPPVRIPVVGSPGEVAVMTSPDSVSGLRAILEASGEPFEIPEIPARFMFQVPAYRPGRRASEVKAPLLVCVCERDKVTPARKTEQLASRAARGEVKRYDAGHFDIYVGDWFERVVADQIDFLERHVPVEATAVR